MTDRQHYRELRDACLNGHASESDISRLNEILSSSEECMDDYLEHAQQDATIEWYGDTRQLTSELSTRKAGDAWKTTRLILGIAASILLMLTVGSMYFSPGSKSVAVLEYSSDCQWGMSSVPTSTNVGMPPGRLRLISGIARLRFPNVTVTLEGPVDMEVVATDRCRLHAGRVVGAVEPGGEGFVVETPSAEIIDRGTKFGVTVNEDGKAQVDVIKGKVEIRHLVTGRIAMATSAETIRASADELSVVADRQQDVIANKPTELKNKIVYITTSDGRGDEASIAYGKHLEGSNFPRPPNTLLVKHELLDPRWDRMALLRFDLTKLEHQKIQGVHLRLEGVATEMGYISMVPDATFAVYGIKEEYESDWHSESVTWSQLTGVRKDAPKVDEEKVQLLGHFQMRQSQPEGRVIVDDDRLAEFLVADTNSTATILVGRLTSGTSDQSYVHGFASRMHPKATPPTLRIETMQE